MCPGCHRLVHAEKLEALASAAEKAKESGDSRAALASWRRALELLPPGSRQHGIVSERAAALSREVEKPGAVLANSGPAPGSRWARWLAPLGPVGLFLWKFKVLVAVALTKGKLLLLGLTKATTLLSALAAVAVYWSLWGWKFAVGVVLAMYVHEMGHVFALSRFGIQATAPMFVPGLGAFVRLNQYPVSPREDARVGLAGPLWGLAAVVVAFVVSRATGWVVWAAVARFSAVINLFNLLPVALLDGDRGFRSLTRTQRLVVVAAMGAAWWMTREGMLILLSLAAGARALTSRGAEEPDRGVLAQFLFLVGTLSAFSTIPVPLS